MQKEDDFNWRLEEAFAAAWPAAVCLRCDNWLLRFSGDAVRRVNSVNPLRGPRGMDGDFFAFVEAFYAERGRKAVFRVPEFASEVTPLLRARGYRAVRPSPTLTLWQDMPSSDDATDDRVELSTSADAAWIDAWQRVNGAPDESRTIYDAMTRAILVPVRFAAIRRDDRVIAQAYAAIHRGVLVFDSVAVDPDHRREGLGRRVVSALLA
ncbi:GNAT family N-acetyltransferase [Pararhizobium mangrovi]|uniref:GNAT family N-acetyltransferase n=1 Tax=Pararhizobium mangrovi TaxID=2590452 RepID=UPI0015E856BC|nr:GNAT family N-acetyltransferase [Pararhizobium mangrovi]